MIISFHYIRNVKPVKLLECKCIQPTGNRLCAVTLDDLLGDRAGDGSEADLKSVSTSNCIFQA